MDVELLVVRECPNEAAAAQLLHNGLDDIGLPDKDFHITVVAGQGDAERRGFTGSPAFFVDGTDLFREPGRPTAARSPRAGCSGTSYPASRESGIVDLIGAIEAVTGHPNDGRASSGRDDLVEVRVAIHVCSRDCSAIDTITRPMVVSTFNRMPQTLPGSSLRV